MVRKVDAGDGSFPSVNTCVHYLKVNLYIVFLYIAIFLKLGNQGNNVYTKLSIFRFWPSRPIRFLPYLENWDIFVFLKRFGIIKNDKYFGILFMAYCFAKNVILWFCYFLQFFQLPDYSSEEVLKERLMAATMEKGFHLN